MAAPHRMRSGQSSVHRADGKVSCSLAMAGKEMFSAEVSEDIQKLSSRDFPGGPMVRTLCSTEGGVKFDPWWGK